MLRKFTAFLFLLCSVCLFISSCKDTCSCKQVPCPAYSNPGLDAWFPYDSGQVNIFSNGVAKDTITFLITYISPAYEANKGCMHADNGCNMQKTIFSKEINNANAAKFVCNWYSSADWDGNNTEKSLQLFVQGFSLPSDGTVMSDTGLVLNPNTGAFISKYFSSLTLNGKQFTNVQQIEYAAPDNKTDNVYKIYIAKSAGLIGYEYFLSKELWVKE